MDIKKILAGVSLVLIVLVILFLIRAIFLPNFGREPTPEELGTVVPTPTPKLSELTLTGLVYDSVTGGAITDATVAFHSCTSHVLRVQTAADGRYTITVPGTYLNCESFTMSVSAPGYRITSETIPSGSLRAQPEQNFALQR